MPTITVFDNEKATLWFHPESGIVHHKFKKPVSGNDFRGVLNQGYELLRENAATKWLSDDRANSALTAADKAWAQDDWFPRVQAVGWEHWAIVLPQNIIGNLDMKTYVDRTSEQGVEVQLFSDPELALQWLETV
jgi:hypothetical protein